MPGIGTASGRAIELRDQPGDQALPRRIIGLSGTLRRHHSDAKFTNGFFPDVRARRDICNVQLLE